MSGLRIVILDSRPGGAGDHQPSAVMQAGWTLVEPPPGLPDARWLREQRVDVVAVLGDPGEPSRPGGDQGGTEPADPWRAILTAARVAACGVVWVSDHGSGGDEGADLPARLAAARWPLWACLSPDAPAWLWVAVCRTLAEAARREADLRRRVERLSSQLEDRKVIERAKGILMDRFDLTESEAYRRMRDTAMRQRKSLREIAQAVVAFDEGD